MEKTKISKLQIKALVITTSIGAGILSLPSQMASILDTGGWLGILLGGLATIPFFLMINKMVKTFPGKNYIEVGEKLVGPIIFNIFIVIILLYNIILLGFTSRVFSDVIKSYLLETTPSWVIISTMLLATSYISRSKINDLARAAVVIYPIIIVAIIFLVSVNLPNLDYTNIYPIFNIDYSKLLKGAINGFFAYSGFGVITLALPLAEEKDKSLKYSLRGIFFVIGVYLAAFFTTLSRYGVRQLKREIWPTISVIKEVNLPGYFLENLDGIVMAMWVIVVFGTMGPFLHMSGVILSDLFNTEGHEIFILPLIPIIYMVANLPKNLLQTYESLGNILNYLFIGIIVIIPTIIFIVAYIKRRREKV